MPKDESPRITSKPPITTECPFFDEPSKCVENETRQWVNDHFANVQDESIDIVPENIIIEVRRSNRKIQKFEIPTEDWPCVQDALDDIRSRHAELLNSELSKIKKLAIQEISGEIRITCPEPFEIVEVRRTIEEVAVPSESELALTWIRDTLGLQGGKRPSVRVGNIARKKIEPFGRDKLSTVKKTARAINALLGQMPKAEKDSLLRGLI